VSKGIARASRSGDKDAVKKLHGERDRMGGAKAYQKACEEGTRGYVPYIPNVKLPSMFSFACEHVFV